MNDLNRSDANPMTVFGDWVPILLDRIDRTDFDAKPIGPVGAYIKLRDQTWAPAVENILGGRLSNFLCHSDRDAKILNRMIDALNIRGPRPGVNTSQFTGMVFVGTV